MKKIIYTVLICIIAIICIFGGYFLTKFKDAFVELGNDVTIDNFVRYGTNKNIDIDLSNNNIIDSLIYKLHKKH